LEEKYQRAIGIYKNHINEKLTLKAQDDNAEDVSDTESVQENASPTIKLHDLTTADTYDSQVSFDDLDDEEDFFSDDEAELRENASDPNITKVEHYLFYLSLKKKKELMKMNRGRFGAPTAGYNRLGSAMARSPSGGSSLPAGGNKELPRSSSAVVATSNDIVSTSTASAARRSKRSSVDSPANVNLSADDCKGTGPRLPNRLASAGVVKRPAHGNRSSLDSSAPQQVGAPGSNGHRLGSAGSMKLTAKSLKEHELRHDSLPSTPQPPISTPEKAKQKKEPVSTFTRMTTVYTLGVETIVITDKEGISRRIFAKNQTKPNFGNAGNCGSGTGAGVLDWAADSSIESDASFTKMNPKIPFETAPVKSIEKLFGITSDSDQSTGILKKHVPEHLWTTRYMKSSNKSVPDKKPQPLHGVSDDDFDSFKTDSGLSYSQSLIMRARQELADSLVSATVDMSSTEQDVIEYMENKKNRVIEKFPSPSRLKRRQSQQWQTISTDPSGAAAKIKKEDSKGDVLQSFSNLMQEERSVSSYVDGRRKNITQSEFRFNRDVDKLDSADEISSLTKVTEASKDLLLWKKFCSERVVSVNKGNELKQIPIRAKTGFHTIYWGKLLIDKSDGT